MEMFRVLVVDDEHDFVDSLTKRLQRRGIACEGAHTGAAAMSRFASARYDGVLLDMMLPDTDGNSVLKAMREIDPEVQAVILTGHASVDAGEQSLHLGAAEYLLKPVELESLLESLRAACVRKRQKRTLKN